MVTTVLITAAVAWLLVGLACYALLRKPAYNILDPLIVLAFFIPFSASFLAALCDTGLVAWDKFILFCLVLACYLVGARTAGAFFDRETFRRRILETLNDVRPREIAAVVLVTLAVTAVLATLAFQSGAEGDARQTFGRLFRPLVLLQGGLSSVSLLLLASPAVSMARAALPLLFMLVLSIPFSGKSILVPLIFWFGLRLFVTHRRPTLKSIVLLGLAVVGGVIVMGMLAYGTTNIGQGLLLLASRLWLSGDTYLYAYAREGLSAVRADYHVSFIAYLLHPLTSLVGVRAYDRPLGAMLMSEVNHVDTLNGPNPHLPVVCDYFFPNQLGMSALVAFATGLVAVSFRPISLMLARCRSRYVKIGGIVAAVFCPASGFLDTSQVLISLVGIAAVTAIGVVLELVCGRPLLLSPAGGTRRAAPTQAVGH